MKRASASAVALLIGVAVYAVAFHAKTSKKDEAESRALEQRFAAAFRAKDVNAIMAFYVPDESLHVFDVIPPREYVGATAYRKDWETFLGMFDGPITFEISDLKVTTGEDVAFSHSIQHFAGKLKNGSPLDVTVRVTDGYRRVGGKWLIAHEHVSVPVDLETGKGDLSSKP
jgi:ketosteroid isomerase-like protein